MFKINVDPVGIVSSAKMRSSSIISIFALGSPSAPSSPSVAACFSGEPEHGEAVFGSV
jgi:hypothetical protein